MTKFFFGLLLLANLLLLGLFVSGFAPWNSAGHEPDRLKQQVHTDRIKLLPEAARLPPPAALPCIEVGNFNKQAAMVFETQLAQLKLPELPQKRAVEELGTYMVFLPPQKKGQPAALQRLAHLRELGFDDIHVIEDKSPRRWGLSLGIFSSKEAAKAQLEHAQRVGAADVRIEQYAMTFMRTAYRLLGLEPDARQGLEEILVKFPGVVIRACE